VDALDDAAMVIMLMTELGEDVFVGEEEE